MRLPPDNVAAARSPSGRVLSALLLVLLALVALASVLVWVGDRWLWHQAPSAPAPSEDRIVPAPPDPRLAYKGPYLNVRPEVKYVGDAACAGCHAVKTDGFHRHPMGRSIVPPPRSRANCATTRSSTILSRPCSRVSSWSARAIDSGTSSSDAMPRARCWPPRGRRSIT